MCLVSVDEPALQFLHHLGHGGIFHLLQRQAVGLKWAVAAHVVSYFICLLADYVKGLIGKHIARPYQLAFSKLKTSCRYPGWPIKATRDTVRYGYWHKGTVM